MKKFKHGVIVGKFMPCTLGHQHLIESGLEHCDKISVLVCATSTEPIDGRLRYNWVNEIFKNNHNVDVLFFNKDVQQYPNSDDDFEFWKLWSEVIFANVGKDFDCLISSEDYGQKLASFITANYNKEVNHVMIDKERIQVPISATMIRNNPYKYWEYIPEIVRPYFFRKVCLVGPESTGKSTLTKLLAEHYNCYSVDEYGRAYTDQLDRKLEEFDILEIAMGQLVMENRTLRELSRADSKSGLLICDTDLIVTEIWSEIYFKNAPVVVQDINKHEAHYDLYLLMDIDVPWVDDGTREFPNLREWHFNRTKEKLEEYNRNYVVISGNYEERLKKSIECIDNLLTI
jgi:NadR type nicotinamide-nucleotide adenylyltransferase